MERKKHLELRMKSIRKVKRHLKQTGEVGSRESKNHATVQLHDFHLPWGPTYLSSYTKNPNTSNVLSLEEGKVFLESCCHSHSHHFHSALYAHLHLWRLVKSWTKNFFVSNSSQSLTRGWKARTLARVPFWEQWNIDILHQVSIQLKDTPLETCSVSLH